MSQLPVKIPDPGPKAMTEKASLWSIPPTRVDWLRGLLYFHEDITHESWSFEGDVILWLLRGSSQLAVLHPVIKILIHKALVKNEWWVQHCNTSCVSPWENLCYLWCTKKNNLCSHKALDIAASNSSILPQKIQLVYSFRTVAVWSPTVTLVTFFTKVVQSLG